MFDLTREGEHAPRRRANRDATSPGAVDDAGGKDSGVKRVKRPAGAAGSQTNHGVKRAAGGAGFQHQGAKRPGYSSSPVSFPENHVMHQLCRAINTRRLLFRILPPAGTRDADNNLEVQTHTVEFMTGARMGDWSKMRVGMIVAPKTPMGLFALQGVTRDGLSALVAAGLQPAAVIEVGRSPHQVGHLDLWIRLAESRLDAATLTAAAKLAGGIAGVDPRPLHWQTGAHAPNLIVPESGKRAYMFEAEGVVASESKALIARAKELVIKQREAAAAACAAGVDPIAAMSILTVDQKSADAAAVYHAQADLARRLGATDDGVIDKSVVLAAFRAGAGETRVRSLLSHSPEVARRRQAAGARARAGEIAEPSKSAADAEEALYITQVIDDVLHDPGLARAALNAYERYGALLDLIEDAHDKRAAVLALRKQAG